MDMAESRRSPVRDRHSAHNATAPPFRAALEGWLPGQPQRLPLRLKNANDMQYNVIGIMRHGAHTKKTERIIPMPEKVANVPRNSDGAISAKYMASTAVVIPDERPTIRRASSSSSTDASRRQKKNITALMPNMMPHISSEPFRPNRSARKAATSDPMQPPMVKTDTMVDQSTSNSSPVKCKS